MGFELVTGGQSKSEPSPFTGTLDNGKVAAAATDNAWGNAYVYDGYGNLLQKNVTAGSAPSLSQGVNVGNNQIVGNSYDANGNQTSLYVPGTGNVELTYDIENRMTAFIGNTGRYAYSAQNQRVWRKTVNGSGQATEVFSFYGIDGKVLETYTPTYSVYSGGTYMALTQSEEELYFAGRLIGRTNWEYTNTFQPISADPLGTVRWDAAVAPNGVTEAFWPWGEERGTVTGNDRVKWGTYWRDSESSLDYGVNRYYSNVTGRFMSADPYQANGGGAGNPSDPQSWNRYAYTRGDPVNRFDPAGMDDCVSGEFDSACDGFIPGDLGGGSGDGWGVGMGWGVVLTGLGYLGGGGGTCPAGYSADASGKCVPDCYQQLQDSIDTLLTGKGSPLASYSAWFVAVGVLDDVDPRLLVALSGAESGYGTSHVATADNNAFGVMRGVRAGGKTTYVPVKYSDFGASIYAAGNVLDFQIYARNNNTVSKLYSGQKGAYCQDSPGFPCSIGASNVTATLSGLGGNPNQLGFPCP